MGGSAGRFEGASGVDLVLGERGGSVGRPRGFGLWR